MVTGRRGRGRRPEGQKAGNLRILPGGLPDPDELIGREKIISQIKEDIKNCNMGTSKNPIFRSFL